MTDIAERLSLATHTRTDAPALRGRSICATTEGAVCGVTPTRIEHVSSLALTAGFALV